MPTLRPYQEEDVKRLLTRPAMGVFNQQRTGKTPTSITTMTRHGVKNLLIIAPKTALPNWEQELYIWSNYNVTVISGSKERKNKLMDAYTSGVLLINYDAVKQTSKSEGLIAKLLKKKFDGIILDEAHRIKSYNKATARSIFKLNKITYRLALTATPAPNKQHEIFSILKFLYPQIFQSYWKFIEKYFTTQKKFTSYGKSYEEVGDLKPGMDKILLQILDTISINRKRETVMPWLPAKDISIIRLNPEKEQDKYLDELKEFYETEDVVTQTTLDRLVRYRQITTDPALLNLKGKSPKTNWVLDYIKEYPDECILIFSNFTSYLKLLFPLVSAVSGVEMIIGDTSIKRRQKIIQDFQNRKVRILLLNIQTCKEAITLDTADTSIFTDLYPPIADIEQAEDRLIATKKDSNLSCKIYRLVLKHTYDEQLLKLIEQHSDAIDVLNNFNKYLKGGNTNEPNVQNRKS